MSTKFRSPSFLIVFSILLSLLGAQLCCAHVVPDVNAVITCSGETVPTADVAKVKNDLETHNYADLVDNVLPLLRDGWSDMVCIIDAIETQNANNPAIKEGATEFKRQHAVEIRNAKRAELLRPPGKGPGLVAGAAGCGFSKAGL